MRNPIPHMVPTKANSAAAARLQRVLSTVSDSGLLVVVGAHHFAADANDPLRRLVQGRRWGGALLVEASPPIAQELRQSIAARNPLPRAPSERVVVSNVGIRDSVRRGAAQNATRTFFTLTAQGDGLPSYSTQIGSFNWPRTQQLVSSWATAAGNWTYERLMARVVRSEIMCRTLVDELRAHAALASLVPAVMLIDVEGLDCRVVAAQDWCSEPLNRLQLLVFEWKHCTEAAFKRAQQSLARCPRYGAQHTFANRENVFYLARDAQR